MIPKAIRHWVDMRLAGSTIADFNLLLLVAVLPAFGVAFLGDWWWWPSGLFLVCWLAFVGWRAWRLFKTGLVDSDASDLTPKG